MSRILIVEDDPHMQRGLRDNLTFEGYAVDVAGDGAEGLRQMLEAAYDLVLLDVMLPQKNGFEVLRESQEIGLTSPVLMMSGRGRQEDILQGFGLGAQDYIVKPFNAEELVARIKAILGRTMSERGGPVRTFQIGDLTFDFEEQQAHRGGQALELSEMEFDLLRHLIRHRGQVVTRKRLLQEAWSIDQDLIAHTISPDIVSAKVDEQINSIRRKIEPRPSEPTYIETVYGLGYRFNS